MKKIISLVVILFSISTSGQAQKLSVSKVPEEVKFNFAKLNPEVKKVSWEKEKMNYEAVFNSNSKKMSQVYTPQGALIETEVDIKSTELPVNVLAKLKGSKIAEAAKITKANGSVVYEAEVKGKDLLFDGKGNRVKL